MYRTITFSMFCDAFRALDRQDQFTYEAKRCLFDYLEDMEEQLGEHHELDVIALCCDFNEESWQDIASNYDVDLSECDTDSHRVDIVRDYLEDHTCVVGEPADGVFVYQVF